MNNLIIILMFFSFSFQINTGQHHDLYSSNILIVYLSRTNNTKILAEIIQQEVGGDLVALELKYPYPENYDAIVEQVAEENESGFLPPLKTKVDVDIYETIFLGFPTWGMQLPPPMKSFLNENNLRGKTVIPFNTNAGYGVGNSFDTIKKMCINCKVMQGFSMKGGIERDGIFLAIKDERKRVAENKIKAWLDDLNLFD